ncbi:MAG: helix-turn-helix domain-containing protein [Armatimonadota bacterium]
MQEMQETDHLLTVKEVAAYLGVSTKTVYRWLRSGTLQGHRAGWTWRVRRSVLDEWLATRRRRESRRHPPEQVLAHLARISRHIRSAAGREFSTEEIAQLVREGRAERATGVY